MTEILKRLVRLRQAKRLRPCDVAKRMNVTRQQIYQIETGRGGDLMTQTLERYAKAIGAELVVRDLPSRKA